MLNFRSVFLITVISVVAQYANAADDDGAVAADKDVVSGKNVIVGSQYYCFGEQFVKCHLVGFFNSEQDNPVDIRVVNCSEEQVSEKLDAMIDPNKEPFEITRIEIVDNYSKEYKRGMRYFNNNKLIHSSGYFGPLDVKGYQKNKEAVFFMGPKSIYNGLKEVTEYKHFISYPCYALRYRASTLTYRDDGTTVEDVALRHKVATLAPFAVFGMAVGAVACVAIIKNLK